MTTLIDQRDVLVKDMLDIEQKAKTESRDMTSEEIEQILAKSEELDTVKDKITKGEAARQKLAGVGTIHTSPREAQAKSLGDHFANHTLDMLQKSGRTIAVTAPAYKAAGDVQTVTETGGTGLQQVDTTVVQGFRERPTVAGLLSPGQMNGTSLTYFVEGAREGGFATVAEGGKKPQMHYAYTERTDGLAKIAGFIKESDEMIKDRAFLVSSINNRLLYDLSMFEEAQLLSGDGTGQNLQGLLNRSGIQTETSAGGADNADAVFRALTKVQTATGLSADGIVINPLDYQAFRLAKDANGQYFGGGFFSGMYGAGNVVAQPNLWGMPTVVTSAVAKGTILVGAFKQAATLYRKDGVSVEATNTNEDDFIYNRVTIRAEERVGLACRIPSALVAVSVK